MNILVGDDDSSTIAKVREQVKHAVEKWSDITHAERAFGGSLYGLQKKHKKLSTKIIAYLQNASVMLYSKTKTMLKVSGQI